MQLQTDAMSVVITLGVELDSDIDKAINSAQYTTIKHAVLQVTSFTWLEPA